MVLSKDLIALLSDDISKDETICKDKIFTRGMGFNKQSDETFQIDFISI